MFYFSATVLQRSQSQFGVRRQVDDIDSNSTQTTNTANSRGSMAAAATATLSSSDELGPLPPGWQMSKADSGRVFFIDHTRKRTTWVGNRSYRKLLIENNF